MLGTVTGMLGTVTGMLGTVTGRGVYVGCHSGEDGKGCVP
jgi:hypothetical protein